MQTHRDAEHETFMERLRERADAAQKAKASTLTGGEPGEDPLFSGQASNGVHVKVLPDEEQGIIRVSLGGGDHLPVHLDYCVIRGPIGKTIELVEISLAAMKELL